MGKVCFREREPGPGLCFARAVRVQESQQESILLPLNVVKRRGEERGEFKAVEKGRFRESDVRNGRRTEGRREEGEALAGKNKFMGEGVTDR